MQQDTTETELERLSWHDNVVYGLRFDVVDGLGGDWHADLLLDLDHIVEWLRDKARGVRFRVAPATLTFHDVTDLRIAIDWGDSSFRTMLGEISIDGISREQIEDQAICLDRPYYRWRIELNSPRPGVIAFGASGSPSGCARSRWCSTGKAFRAAPDRQPNGSI